MDDDILDAPRVDAPPMSYPQWMDAPYIAVASRLSTRVVRPTAVGGAPVVQANAERFAIGFKVSTAAAADARVSPERRASLFGWLIERTGQPLWFTASLFGSAVVGEWYINGTITDEVMVYELILN